MMELELAVILKYVFALEKQFFIKKDVSNKKQIDKA